MNEVSLTVNDEAKDVVIGVLAHLEHLSDKGQKRTIRIGGDEKVYDGSSCEVTNVEVDGQPQASYTPVKPARRSGSSTSTIGTSNVVGAASVSSTPPSVSAVAQATQQATAQGAQGATMSKELEEKVDVILTDLCEGEGLFTAYDVTREIRNDGTRCRHADIRRLVHDTYNNGEMDADYTRSLVFVDGSVQAFVYHPDNVDPNVYTGDDSADADADDNGASNVDPLDALD